MASAHAVSRGLASALVAITGGTALAQTTAAPDKTPDWIQTDFTIATALATGRYEIKASYRTIVNDTPVTVYVLQDPSNREDVVECYADDAFRTSKNCMKPSLGAP